MLKPRKMSKIRLVCPKSDVKEVVKALHNLSVMHITEFELENTERSGPLPAYDAISQRLMRIRSLLESMGGNDQKQIKKAKISNPIELADKILLESEGFFALIKEREEVRKELESVTSMQKKSKHELEGFDVDMAQLGDCSLQFIVVRSPIQKAKILQDELSRRKNCAFAKVEKKKEKQAVFLVALPKKDSPKFLEAYGATSIAPSTQIASLASMQDALEDKLASVERKIKIFTEEHYANIVALEEALSIEADRARLAMRFRETPTLYFIEGWIFASKMKELKAEFSKKFGKRVLISEVKIGHHDKPPTFLDNPEISKPFEYVVKLISLPRYNEIDPTIILTFAIPIIYALILGDAGYAIISFFIAGWLVKISKDGSILNEVSKIWKISAIPTFFAGVMFDEYFGFRHSQLLKMLGYGDVSLYEGFSRLHSLQDLIAVSLTIGLIHVALGFLIGVINEWHHHRKHAYAKLSWLGIEVSGTFLILSGIFGIFPFLLYPSAAIFIISAISLALNEGFLGIIEIPGLFGNVMSYIRIAAVGVGGLIIAEIINHSLVPKIDLSSAIGIASFVFATLVFVSLHLAACILAMFESIIHSTRLNVVEFFGKFYNGNGIRFEPFACQRKYTSEED